MVEPRLIAAAVALAALWPAAPAVALTPQPFVDVTPEGSELILCPADLGGGAGLAWQRFSENARGGNVLDLSAAGLRPPTPSASLLPAGGCPSTATAASGASLIAVNRTGFSSDDPGPVFVVDRAPAGPASAPIAIAGTDRAHAATVALAAGGAALVAWKEDSASGTGDETAYAAARDAGAAFTPKAAVGARSSRVEILRAGVDDAGFGLVVSDQDVSTRGDDTRLVYATRPPGGAFTAPRDLGGTLELDSLSLAVAPDGEALLALSDSGGVRIATGTAREGLGTLRPLGSHKATGVSVALSASGAAAVAWIASDEEPTPAAGVVVSDRPAGGDFGAPRALVAGTSRLGANRAGLLRLAAAADGRMLASWSVSPTSGELAGAPVLVAAQRRADGTWEPVVAVSGPCRQPIDGFPGFDASGQPRVTMVDSGLISGGDYGFPSDTRVRVVGLGGAAPALGPPPKVTLSAARRQVLRRDRIELRVRCALLCDARVFSVIRGRSGAGSGLFPAFRRLRAGRTKRVVLKRGGYFDRTGHVLSSEGAGVKVRLVVHACDSAGRLARARRTITVAVPRSRRP